MSGDEKSAAIHLPLFAAANALYSSAKDQCPRLQHDKVTRTTSASTRPGTPPRPRRRRDLYLPVLDPDSTGPEDAED